MYATYECVKCHAVFEYKKPYGEDFPDVIKSHRDDSKCKSKCEYHRSFDTLPVISVSEGSVGNAANGYSKTVGSYAPSPLTPLNRVYGASGRSSMFNDNGTVG